MKRKRKAAPPSRQSDTQATRRCTFKVLNAEQRKKLPYTLPSSSTTSQTKPNVTLDTTLASENATQSIQTRRKASIAPNPCFQPFLDVVIRRASSEASTVIDSRISRDAIHQHPSRSDILLGECLLDFVFVAVLIAR